MKVMIKRGLLVRGQRTKLRPAKGKDKLSAWPRHLTKVTGPAAGELSTDDAFYGWTYERPTGVMTYVLGGLVRPNCTTWRDNKKPFCFSTMVVIWKVDPTIRCEQRCPLSIFTLFCIS